MLKVAVVTHYFPSAADPWAGNSAYQTLRLLAAMCEVHVFCSVVQYPKILGRRREAPVVEEGWKPEGVETTYVPYVAIPGISRVFNGAVIARQSMPHVRAFRPDIILSYVVYPHGFSANLIARSLGVPSVLTAIGSDLNRISDRLTGMLTRSALRQADFVTTVSRDLCQTAVRLGADPAKSRPILNGCNTDVFKPQDKLAAREQLGLAADARIILYVGRLDLRKGLLELVEAMISVRAAHPEAQCYVLGDGPAKPALMESIERHQLEETVRLLPSGDAKRVATWIAASDLLTLPSYNEGCPNVVIEALSCGRPVVATKVGGIPELMDECSGRLIPVKDVQAISNALKEVLMQSWDAQALSQVHSRSWSDVAEELMDVFESLPGRQ